MNTNTKTKPVVHLTKKDKVVLTNQTSGKQNVYKVHGVEYDETNYPALPVRLIVATPDLFDDKASAVIGYNLRDNVDVLMEEAS